MSRSPRDRTGWRDLTWAAFCDWVSGRKAVHTSDVDGDTYLRFADGTEAIVSSNYEGPWSDVTPGAGIQPPTVVVKDGAP